MKRISTFLLTLVLSVSLLVPGFSMPSDVYAEGETPAAEVVMEEAGSEAAQAEDSAAADSQVDPGDSEKDSAGTSAADQAGEEAVSTEALDAGETDTEEPAAEEGSATATEINAYDTLRASELYEAGALVIPSEYKDKVEVTQPKNADGLLFTGSVSDLNAMTMDIAADFNFDNGTAGRAVVDGLKDKDRGLSVDVELSFDGSLAAAVPLKKQTGKKEWTTDGEKSVSMSEISGKHKLALKFKVSGKKDSAKTSVLLRSVRFCKTTLPVIYFNIDESEGTIEAMNNSEDHSVECYGSAELVVPPEFNNDTTFRDEYGKQDSLTGDKALELEYIRGRGNSTWGDEKKPYKVKFAKGVNLFGFGKNKHWVLLANRYDNSLIRNRMTYWLGQQLGMEYTPQCVPVEVVMNGEFLGSYLLCEQIRVGTGRVEIDDLDDVKDAPAVTDEMIKSGGYLLSMDFNEDEDRSFKTKNNMQLFIESPDDNVTYFSDYIKAYTQKVENAVLSQDFKDADGHPYTDYLDMDSAVDYWWIQEFSTNGDAYSSGSTYLYKKRDSNGGQGKLYWGPLWDFDYVAWGDLDYESEPQTGLDTTQTLWFNAMRGDPVFISKVKARWNNELRGKLTDITKKGGLLDKYLKQMETSYNYDHEKWGPYESKITEYKGEIEQLRTWIDKRIAIVDEEVAELSDETHTVTFMADGKLVKEVKVAGAMRKVDFPEAPAKDGYVFMSWVDENGFDYTEGSRITEDIVLNANYLSESDVIHVKDIFFKDYDVYYPQTADPEFETDWFTMEYSVMPAGSIESENGADITWTSSDEEIAKPVGGSSFEILKKGDVTITATIGNSVSNTFKLHVVDFDDLTYYEEATLSTEELTLKPGDYSQLLINEEPQPCEGPEFMWISTDEEVATVDDLGVVSAVAPGQAELLAINSDTREVMRCKVTVKPDNNVGTIVTYKGSEYEITSDSADSKTAELVKARNAKSITIPASVKLGDDSYAVTGIRAKAFSKAKKVKTVYVKTKKLTKASVKGSLKSCKVKKIKVRVGKKKTNKKYAKKYRKYFAKKNSGRKVKVS